MENEQETTYSNYEAAIKAKELFEPIEDEDRKKKKAILGNAATIISTLAVFLTIVLFSYNLGYSSVFNIPVKCIPLDIKLYSCNDIRLWNVVLYLLVFCFGKDRFCIKEKKN